MSNSVEPPEPQAVAGVPGRAIPRDRHAFEFVERRSCPVCGSGKVDCRYDRGFAEPPISNFLVRYYGVDPERFGKARYSLVRCAICTLLFQRWVGDAALLAELYGQWIALEGAPERDPLYRRDVGAPSWSRDGHEILTVAAYLGKPVRALRVLDYGMGWALWARIAKALGCDVAGVELSADRRAFAQSYGIEVLHDDELGQQRFDFINTDQLLEHVTDPGETCERLAVMLVPGGILKVSVPDGHSAERIMQRLVSAPELVTDDELMPVQPLEHVNCFTDRTIEHLAKQAGLRVAYPNIAQRYAFLRHPPAIPREPKQLIKELIRPFYTFRNASNLYRWLCKDAVDRGRP